MRSKLTGIKIRKTKPLDIKRKYARKPKEIVSWYRGHQDSVISHGITPDRIRNFDESDFRVGMSKGETF